MSKKEAKFLKKNKLPPASEDVRRLKDLRYEEKLTANFLEEKVAFYTKAVPEGMSSLCM